jgi:hypothetical protein
LIKTPISCYISTQKAGSFDEAEKMILFKETIYPIIIGGHHSAGELSRFD